MSPAAARPATNGRGRIATRATEAPPGLRRPSCAPVQPAEPVSRRRLIRIGAVAVAAALLVAVALRTVGAMTAVRALELEAIAGLVVWLVFGRRISATLLPQPRSTHDR